MYDVYRTVSQEGHYNKLYSNEESSSMHSIGKQYHQGLMATL